MKQFYLIVLAIISFQIASSTEIIAINNGNWKTASTWNLNRIPANGDSVKIPGGRTVTISSSLELSNVRIQVGGTLRIGGFISILSLLNNSSIIVQTGAKIEGNWLLSWITLNGSAVYAGGDVWGPVSVHQGSSGFVGYDPLPVKFSSFTATSKGKDVMLEWTTAAEFNAHMYEVERSFDGTEWRTIAYVSATGTSMEESKYAFTDKNVPARNIHYRIKEVDADGQSMATEIKTVKPEIEIINKINIASAQGKVMIQFPAEVKGNMIVRFVNLGGQVVDQQVISNPSARVMIQPKSNIKGNYIISVGNGADVQVARQVNL